MLWLITIMPGYLLGIAAGITLPALVGLPRYLRIKQRLLVGKSLGNTSKPLKIDSRAPQA